MNDIDILQGIRQGDEGMLDHLYQRYYRRMIIFFRSRGANEEEAKDIFQETLIVFWQKVMSSEFVLTTKISTYLYSVCLNQWKKELTRKSRYLNQQVEVEQKEEIAGMEDDESMKILLNCMKELGEVCKKVLTLFYFEDMNMNDIAKRLNFQNADTAKTKKYKCKKRLDMLIKSKYSEQDFFD